MQPFGAPCAVPAASMTDLADTLKEAPPDDSD
jgi:hypothetical protein